jgi:hypothetical protein
MSLSKEKGGPVHVAGPRVDTAILGGLLDSITRKLLKGIRETAWCESDASATPDLTCL